MNKKLIIVVNVDSFFLSHRKDIAIAAMKEGIEVVIVAQDTGRMGDIRALGMRAINLKINPSGMNLREEWQTIRFLTRLFCEEKPDIVHLVGPKINLWGALAARLAKVPAVVSAVSGMGVIMGAGGLLSRVMPAAYRLVSRQRKLLVIFQNREDEALYLRHKIVRPEQCRYIMGSGIHLDEYTYTPEPEQGKIIILFTARMIVEKGVFVLQETAKMLYNEYKGKIQFRLCGGTVLPERKNYIPEEKLNNFGDDDYFVWMGQRDDIREQLQQCHIFAFPSYYREGLPKSCIEANASGRPIITTNVIGCKDTVVDGETGFIIPGNDPQALADKLRILIEDKALRQQMGKAARKYAEKHFSIDRVVAKHMSIYHELLS